MYLTILFLPLLSSLLSGLLGFKLGYKGSHLLCCSIMVIGAILSCILFYEVALSGSVVHIKLNNWVNIDIYNWDWGLYYDSLTISMLLLVFIISSLVHIYSISYMSTDPSQQRFFSYLSLFTFFMVLLVSADNYLLLFLSWEGIGVVSFLLIGFWTTRIKAVQSSLKALLMNRFGDYVFSIGLFLLLVIYGAVNYNTIFTSSPHLNSYILTFITISFLGGAAAKSALLGLHNWLPKAMEGPGPVSSLIHSSTLVTAGLYLLLRSSLLLEYSNGILLIIAILGSISAFFAASIGLFKNDIKEVIAFSTMSQCSYIFIAIGLSQYNVAIYHLVNHGFFKALLFLSAGSLIHAVMDRQDIRRLGGLLFFLPFTYICFLIGSLSLMAVIGFSGYYSKDFILELAGGNYLIKGSICYLFGLISACLTSFYSFRLISISFYGYANSNLLTYKNIHEGDNLLLIPMGILSIFAIYFGYIFNDLFIGWGSDAFSFLYQLPNKQLYTEAHFGISGFYKILPFITSVLFSSLAIYLYAFNNKFSFFLHFMKLSILNRSNKLMSILFVNIYKFFNFEWHLDTIYYYLFTLPVIYLGLVINKIFDKGVLEIIGPYGTDINSYEMSSLLGKYDEENITTYALIMIVGFFGFSLLALLVGMTNLINILWLPLVLLALLF